MNRRTFFLLGLSVLLALTIIPGISAASKHNNLSAKTASTSPISHAPLDTSTGNFTLPSGLVYEQDCNDADNPLPTWMCAEPNKAFLPPGYPYYVGHDEPLIQFYSTVFGSSNNFQWKIQLPQADPSPTQDGTTVVNAELYSTFWFSVALCDNASTPFNPCNANDDSNTASAGSAILELQFYPPGRGCSSTQWCASMTIDELTTNCGEPITAAPITTDGTPGGPRLLMSAGDSILITIKDTMNGLENDVNDLSSSTTGSMVASGSNGFTQTIESTHQQSMSATCSTSPFSYHTEYNTATQNHQGSWINANVDLSFELGHWEVCGDSGCSSKPDSDTDDTSCGKILGVGGCTGADNDLDGPSYVADWPDGASNHPNTLIIGSPTDNGIGPTSIYPYGGPFPLPYTEGYAHMCFGYIVCGGSAPGANFYPFYSQAGTGASCRFNFGNDITGTTTNDFGKASEYRTAYTDNACLPGTFDYVMTASNPTPAPNLASYPTILRGGTATYQVTLSLISGPAEQVTLLSDHTKEPTGAASSFSPPTIYPTIDGATSTYTIVTSATGGIGKWILHFHGTSTTFPCPSIAGCKTINPLVQLGTYDFAVNVSPSDQTVLRGGSTSYNVNVTRTPETTACFPCPFSFAIPGITPSTSGLPLDASPSFGSYSIVPTLSGSTTTLTITTAAPPTGALGDYTFTVTGSDANGGTRSGSSNLHIYDFSIAVASNLLILTTGKNSYTVNVILTPGSSTIGLPTISLSSQGLPAGASSFFTPSSGLLTFASTFNVTTVNTTAGNYTLKLTGADSRSPEGGQRTASPVLVVLSPQAAIKLIVNQVNAMQSGGVLTSTQASDLTNALNQAIISLNAGKTKTACNQLKAFVNIVRGYAIEGILTQGQANQLLNPPLGVLAIEAQLGC